jgi:hypothetical protein
MRIRVLCRCEQHVLLHAERLEHLSFGIVALRFLELRKHQPDHVRLLRGPELVALPVWLSVRAR